MDSADLSRLFNLFDRNGDGKISQKEFSESMEKIGVHVPSEVLTEMIKTIDGNGDGCLGVEGFRELYTTIMEGKERGGDEEDMREAFKVFDKDGDGFITAEELKVVLSALGLTEGRSIEDCREMISRVDADDDGRVNFEEFMQMMKR